MPVRAPRPCSKPGCSALTTDNSGRCDKHPKASNWEIHQLRHGNRHQRGYGTEWDKRRKPILIRDRYLCQACYRLGKLTPTNTVDHIIPRSRQGTEDDSNLEAICTDCHDAKTARESNRR